ncbi:MAG: hypothetical protein SVM80_11375 [Halobacteriota archaeon]|nr:hypothetical protein [Halobacteriota archaeon]
MNKRLKEHLLFIPIFVLLSACAFLSLNYVPKATVILLLGIAITIPFVRRMPDELSKIIAYMFLGISAYTLVGISYRGSYTSDPKLMFTKSFPMIMFAIVNALAILITTEDKDSHGYIFAGMGFSAIFSSSLFDMGQQYDMLMLVLAVLWSVVPLIFCRVFSKQIFTSTTILRRFSRTILGLVLSFPVYLLIVTLSVLVIINQASVNPTVSISVSMDAITGVLQSINADVAILGVLWYYSAPHIIFILGAFMVYNLIFFDALGYKKHVVSKTGEITYTAPKKTRTTEKKIDEADPYQGLLGEVKSQMPAFRNITDRIKAFEVMQRFKNEYETLHTKYGDTAVGTKVRDSIRKIEEDFRSRYN